ncbi:hypothetical protein C1645_836893 [Glomus cerebriforme]|uniref:Uncharacterized protein n=1 Tax=Glomus cerebriforme TaxID=658196 RepID=A0A397S677_9GLOM|nr:hypothetical protein C1645_836893 [Glomus cerebriforme]
MNNSQTIPHSNDFPMEMTVVQHQELQHQQILFKDFYYLSPNDNNFYFITCKIILQDDPASFDDHNCHNHVFFYQHPSIPSAEYYVTCKLLPYHLIENILNNTLDFNAIDLKLSLHQRFNLEKSLKQKLFDLFHCNRNANSIVSMTDNQNYNDSGLPSNDHIVYQDTNELNDIYYNNITHP